MKCIVIAITLVGMISYSAYSNSPAVGDTYQKIRILVEAIDCIEKNYVDTVNMVDLTRGAINGMMQTLDPHSAYMTPEANKEFDVQMKGSFGGIGTEIAIKDGELTVVA
ncbi:MAG: peptidase S41, partial [Deltaproteobacteria bacterium]